MAAIVPAGGAGAPNDEDDGGDFALLFPPTAESADKNGGLTIKYDTYKRPGSGEELSLALVQKHHSLWAEYIYNAARVLSDLMERGDIAVGGKRCIEFGAGAGLPGIVAALKGASVSVITDYGTPSDRDLVDVIDINIAALKARTAPCSVHGAPFIFGASVQPLLQLAGGHRFDVVLMADLIFNRSEHRKLLQSLREVLAPGGQGWVAFSHHDPKKTPLDLAFFSLAEKDFGFDVRRVGQEERESYPFVQKDGMDDKRGVVNIYLLQHREGDREQE